jgi:heme O synthase-like polyprenyltransferase
MKKAVSNRALLLGSYPLMLIYVLWPVLEDPKSTDIFRQSIAIAFFACCLVLVLSGRPRFMLLAAAGLNALLAIAIAVAFSWTAVTHRQIPFDADGYPIWIFFGIYVPSIAAYSFFTAARPRHS